MTYDETIKYLYSLEKFGIRLGLENISALLIILDNPHNKFKSIHIAGTNGKGSTAAMTASILQSAGYKTGLYTSPHLEDFRERIMINGVMIPEGDVIELTEEIRSKMKGLQLTFFEFTTAMAFLYFEREKVDFAVLEVGMGGRLDATNVLNPALSIITEIDIEHTEHLGEDIKSITKEKGGIIKDNGTVILSSSKPDVIETIESICEEKKAKLYRFDKDFIGERENTDIHSQQFKFREMLSLRGKAEAISHSFEISLLGKYQITNASTAVKAALLLKGMGFDIGVESIRRGIKNVQWSGRLEIVSDNPIIILDGAHNPAAAKVLSEELKGMRINKLILIIGILKDKDYKGIISFLAPIADYVIVTKPKTNRVRESEDLKNESLRYTDRVEVIEDIPDAVKKAKNLASADDLICITGSFFTVGEARKMFNLQN
jgi:dihydrofolate synthase/folylpolyglutamate synthase